VLHRASRGVHIVILFSWACRKETMILPLFQECSRVGLKMTPASREERTVRALWLRIDNGWNYKENIAMSKANGRKVRESEGRALGSQPKVGLEGGVWLHRRSKVVGPHLALMAKAWEGGIGATTFAQKA
jgi:hypothetical protein